MTLRLNGSTSGYVEIDAPATAGSNTLVLPTGNGTSGQVLSTNGSGALSWVDRMTAAGPAFRAYANTQTTLTSATSTKVILGAEDFDTGNCFASSRFTPTVAGYYFVSAGVNINSASTTFTPGIWKNGSEYAWGNEENSNIRATVDALVYLNGSTDYVEVFVYQNSGSSKLTMAFTSGTYFSGFLARPA